MKTIDSFAAGLNAQFDPSKVMKAGQYPLLINGRVRDDTVTPIFKPLQLETPAGNYQGVYHARNFILIFISGKAYYRNYAVLDAGFVEIPGFQLDANVQYIYASAIPASTSNFLRVSEDGDASSIVNFTTASGSSAACVLCQDGINQSFVILPNGTARVTQNFDQWTQANREYVPIGTDMLYDSGILYMFSPDKTKLFRSVTGRPLDFVIAIDAAGNKLSPEAGDANALSHAVSHEPSASLNIGNSKEKSIYISTIHNSYFTVPDFERLFFSEPTFRNIPLFPTGAVNSFSYIELLGDQKFIDIYGLRSFNAVLQFQNQGNNTPFSKKIGRFLKDVKQRDNCAIRFDNYGFFSVNTVYGPAVVVYDEEIEQFISLDIYEGIAKIKMFAQVTVGTLNKLIFITEDNKCYEAFAGDTRETCQIYAGDWACEASNQEQLIKNIYTLFTEVTESGIVYATMFCDGKRLRKQAVYIKQPEPPVNTIPILPPFGDDNIKSVFTATFNVNASREKSFKVGVWIEWNFAASLSVVSMEDEMSECKNQAERVASYAAMQNGIPVVTDLSPISGIVTTIVFITGDNLSECTGVFIGTKQCQILSVTDELIKAIIPLDADTDQLTLVFPQFAMITDQTFTVT